MGGVGKPNPCRFRRKTVPAMPSKPMPTRMKVPGSGTLDEDQRPGLAFTRATPINASELHETLIELSWGEPTRDETAVYNRVREVYDEAIQALAGYLAAGKLKYRESIVEGLDNAPRGLIGLLKGENFGKQLVKLD